MAYLSKSLGFRLALKNPVAEQTSHNHKSTRPSSKVSSAARATTARPRSKRNISNNEKPFSLDPTRRPGAYSSRLAREALARAIGLSLVGLGTFVYSIRLYQSHGPRMALLALMAFEFVCLRVTSSNFARRSRAKLGARSEQRVAGALSALVGATHFNGVPLAHGGDVDHYVASPYYAAIETKTGYGTVTVVGAHLQAGSRQIPKDPIAQILSGATQLAHALGRPIRPIVCVTDQTNPPFYTRGVLVCSLKDLPGALALSGASVP